MKDEKIPITNDYIFKKIFSKKGNEDILKDLLIGILEIPIEKIEVQSEVSLEKELIGNKLGRLDIVAVLNDDTIINIEMQVGKQYNYIDRSLYYWSGSYYNDLKAGEDYSKTKKTIGINILNYELFKEGPYHEIGRLKREYNNKVITDKMEIHYIQLPKFIKERKGTETKLEQWMQFLCQKDKRKVEQAMVKNKEIRKANAEYGILTGEAYERRLAYLIDKGQRDYNTQIIGARNEGRQEGRQEGIKEGKQEGIKEGKQEGIKEGRKKGIEELAKKLLKLGVSNEIIEKAVKSGKNEIRK